MAIMRPAEHTNRQLVSSILTGSFPPFSALPPERELAEQIGVTRPTLREALQRLAAEGWITIAQGKSTVVNDYWREGGLGILRSVIQFGDAIPSEFINDVLDLRGLLVPRSTTAAAERAPEVLLEHLARAVDLADDAEAFVAFDWELQLLVVRHCGNRLLPLMWNDFAPVFERVGALYFSLDDVRAGARGYYAELAEAIRTRPEDVAEIVERGMLKAAEVTRSLLRCTP